MPPSLECCVEKNWLKKPGMTQQILGQMKLYKPTVKFSEDQNGNRKPYPPTVKVALRKKNDKFETTFFGQDKKEIQAQKRKQQQEQEQEGSGWKALESHDKPSTYTKDSAAPQRTLLGA